MKLLKWPTYWQRLALLAFRPAKWQQLKRIESYWNERLVRELVTIFSKNAVDTIDILIDYIEIPFEKGSK